MKFISKKKLKKLFLGFGVFASSFLATFYIAKAMDSTSPGGVTVEEGDDSASTRLINSLLNYEATNINGFFNITLEDATKININVDGQAKFSDIENIVVGADIDADIGGTSIKGRVGYFVDTLTFAVDDVCYFKLKTDNITDFVSMIPTDLFNISLPAGLNDISLDTIMDIINAVEDKDKKQTGTGGYYYPIVFGAGSESVEIKVITDAEDHFLGIRTDNIQFNDTRFQLDISIEEIKEADFLVENPLNDPIEAQRYQDFSPVFAVAEDVLSIINSKKFGVSLNASVELKEDEQFKELVDASIVGNVDLENKDIGIDVLLHDKNRNVDHVIETKYVNNTIYAKVHNVAVSIEKQTITDLIKFVMDKIDMDTLSVSFDSLKDTFANFDIAGLSESLRTMFKSVSISESKISITVDLKEFGIEGLDLDPITIEINSDEGHLKSINISRIEIGNVALNLSLDVTTYVSKTINPEDYVDLKPLSVAAQAFLDLLEDKKYRIEIEAGVDDHDDSTLDLDINGGFQFDVNPDKGSGFGELNITDSKGYLHNIKANMQDKDTFFFSYNDSLNGKFSSATIEDMISLITSIVADPDEHFIELFGELIDKLQTSPISLTLSGDYLAILTCDIITNLNVDNTHVEFDLSLALAGLEQSMHIALFYSGDESDNSAILDRLEITKLDFGGKEISATISLKKYNTDLVSPLTGEKTYLDFSDIKVLLELGVNTSKFNYYHMSISANLNAIGGLFNLDIPIDLKIRNEKGHVKIAIEFSSIPIKALVNPNDSYASEKNRKASVYYEDELWYISRTEEAKEKGFLGIGKGSYKTYQLIEICDNDYFLDNLFPILLGDILSMSSSITSLIENSSLGTDDSKVIHYEKLINDFAYVKGTNQDYFLFDIYLKELSSVLLSCIVKVYDNPETSILNKVSVDLQVGLSSALKMNVSLSVSLLSDYSVDVFDYDEEGNIIKEHAGTSLTAMDNFIAAHANDPVNQKRIYFGGSRVK